MAFQESSDLSENYHGALRKGPPFHGSRSSREIKFQNASSQTGVVAKLQGDKTASFCREMSGREVTGR